MHCFFWLIILLFVLDVSAAKRSGGTGGSDLSLNAYTDEGEVAQVVFAAKAVAHAPVSVIGSLSPQNGGYSLLFSVRKKPSRLMVDTRAVLERGGDFFVGVTGIPADCAACRSHINVVKNSQQFTFGKLPSMTYLAHALVMWLTRGMYRSETGGGDDDGGEDTAVVRPIAASALLSGVDDGCLRLVAVECSGAVRDCTFACLGEASVLGGQPLLRRLEDALAAHEVDEGGDGGPFEMACGAVTRIAELLLQEEGSDGDAGGTEGAVGDEDEVERGGSLLMECSITTLSPKASRLIGPFSSLQRLRSLLNDAK